MYKGFVTLAVLLLLVAAAFIGGKIYLDTKSKAITYQSQASPGPFDNWKTYSNKTYGFSIRYPKEWYIKEHSDYAADFWLSNPSSKEGSPAAIAVRFSKLDDIADFKDFQKVYDLMDNETSRQTLDVKSIITKIRNFEVQGQRAIEYKIDRTFTALQGPKGEYRHIFEIEKGEVILSFLATATTREELRWDGLFQQIISSIKF